MREKQPMTQTVKASEARRQWSGILNRVFRKETRVIVEKSGIPVAAIVSADDLERLNQFEAQREERFTALEETGRAFKDVPVDELEQEVAKAIASVRRKRHAQEQRASQAQ